MLGGPPRAIAAAGLLAGVLMGLPASVLKTVDGWAAGGGSSRRAQDETGWLLDGKREVAAAGVCGALVVSVGGGRERVGPLVLADRALNETKRAGRAGVTLQH